MKTPINSTVLWFTDLINVTGEVTIHRPDVSTLLSSAFMLFQTCTKLTFGLSDVFFVTVIARNTINGVGSLFFPDRILRFGKNMPQSLKRFLSNFNVVAIQNSLDGFRNTLNIARHQGHFEPANNYQRYIVLHSGTIEYQENSIWRRSRLDLQRRVFRIMTYII